ncbi:unnamed protein product, partial [marine sediment metagenome]
MTYKTEGIILKYIDLGETSRLLTIYTKDFGKILAQAKGVKKSSSRLAGHLEPLTYSKLTFAKGRNLDIIIDSFTLVNFLAKLPLERRIISLKLAYLMDQAVQTNEKDLNLWQLLFFTFSYLAKTNHPLIVSFFRLQLLKILGFGLELERCVSCGKPLPREAKLIIDSGGVVCNKCLDG